MVTIGWTIVFDTWDQTMALKLLERALRRMRTPVVEAWLRPWGEERRQFAAQLTSTIACEPVLQGCLVPVLEIARRLAATWTVDFPGVSEDALLEAWMPREYRRWAMDGIVAASLVVRREAPREAVDWGSIRVKQRNLLGVMVHIVEA